VLQPRSPSAKFETQEMSETRMSLILSAKSEGVPNGRGEQPQRKPGVRERFRASFVSPRCTAIHEKRPNSWAFQRRSADGETVRIGRVGGESGIRTLGARCEFMRLRPTPQALSRPGDSTGTQVPSTLRTVATPTARSPAIASWPSHLDASRNPGGCPYRVARPEEAQELRAFPLSHWPLRFHEGGMI
jgi:hypothetical protein